MILSPREPKKALAVAKFVNIFLTFLIFFLLLLIFGGYIWINPKTSWMEWAVFGLVLVICALNLSKVVAKNIKDLQ
jgi:hypothetical protein